MKKILHCTYLTMYTGSKLPKWYIGKSTVQKVNNGYNGSVTSKKYKSIYDSEQTLNKHLFKTRILSTFLTAEEALTEELRLQKMHKVLKNQKYINMAYASINGFFGMDNIGHTHSEETKMKIGLKGKNHPMYGKTHSDESKLKNSISNMGHKAWNKGQKHSEESKLKNSISHKGKVTAFNIISNEFKTISKELFDNNPNWKGCTCKEATIFKNKI